MSGANDFLNKILGTVKSTFTSLKDKATAPETKEQVAQTKVKISDAAKAASEKAGAAAKVASEKASAAAKVAADKASAVSSTAKEKATELSHVVKTKIDESKVKTNHDKEAETAFGIKYEDQKDSAAHTHNTNPYQR